MRTTHLALASAFFSALVAVACTGTVIGPGGNPPSCPDSFPDGLACSDETVTCVYTAADCEITFACEGSVWTPQPASCMVDCLWGSGDGTPCWKVGVQCSFGDECNEEAWTCGPDHVWDVVYTEYDDCCFDCECLADECPVSPPLDGDLCDPCYDSPDCFWEAFDECGGIGTISAECAGDYTWHVVATPPPPCEDCTNHLTAEGCVSDPNCRWLAPGCEDPTLNVEACYPAEDCAPDSGCPGGTACIAVNANTCGLLDCVMCETVLLCLPDP